MSFVDRDGGKLHWQQSGRSHGPALLLVHSLGANAGMWAPQLPALERHFRVIRYDLPGHGKSTLAGATPRARSMADLADDALAVLDAARVERAHWVGLSIGGMISMWAATHAPARVQRLVLANTTAFMGPPAVWDERIATIGSQGLEPIVAGMPARWFTPEFVAREPDAVEKIATLMRTTDPVGYVEACGAIRDMDQRESIAAIRAPTLVIAGARDPGTTIEHAEGLVARIAGSDLVVLDASHLSNVEQADEFNEQIVTFLRD